jgi:hypothetical protein
MARIIAAAGSSHASTFLDPSEWETFRNRVRTAYERRYNEVPPERVEVEGETADTNRARYGRIREGLDFLKARIEELKPDTLILIGDDQNENYRDDNLPQFAIYTGDELISNDRQTNTQVRFHCDAALARHLMSSCVEDGFDLASSRRFPDEALISHAHTQVLADLDPQGRLPIVPVFVNAINVPAPSPKRCYAFGQALRHAIEAFPEDRRVMLYASGGWSHFTAGFPWPSYDGPATLGAIAEDFDHQLFRWMESGQMDQLSTLSTADLRDNGGVEMRQWIVLLGAVGNRPADRLVYEPFYRAVLAMAVGYWDLTKAGSESTPSLVGGRV